MSNLDKFNYEEKTYYLEDENYLLGRIAQLQQKQVRACEENQEKIINSFNFGFEKGYNAQFNIKGKGSPQEDINYLQNTINRYKNLLLAAEHELGVTYKRGFSSGWDACEAAHVSAQALEEAKDTTPKTPPGLSAFPMIQDLPNWRK